MFPLFRRAWRSLRNSRQKMPCARWCTSCGRMLLLKVYLSMCFPCSGVRDIPCGTRGKRCHVPSGVRAVGGRRSSGKCTCGHAATHMWGCFGRAGGASAGACVHAGVLDEWRCCSRCVGACRCFGRAGGAAAGACVHWVCALVVQDLVETHYEVVYIECVLWSCRSRCVRAWHWVYALDVQDLAETRLVVVLEIS